MNPHIQQDDVPNVNSSKAQGLLNGGGARYSQGSLLTPGAGVNPGALRLALKIGVYLNSWY